MSWSRPSPLRIERVGTGPFSAYAKRRNLLPPFDLISFRAKPKTNARLDLLLNDVNFDLRNPAANNSQSVSRRIRDVNNSSWNERTTVIDSEL